MDQRLLRATWLGGLGVIISAPSLAYLALSSSGGFWHRLSVLTGLLALSALVCAAVLPSRLRSLNRAFGIESVIDVHRFFGVTTAALVFAHLACVVAASPSNITLLDLTTAPGRAKAATISTLALVALAGLTVLRNQARLSYELWKWSHVTLAATALVAAALHVWLLDQLMRDAVIGPMAHADRTGAGDRVRAPLGVAPDVRPVHRVRRPRHPAREPHGEHAGPRPVQP